MSDAKVAATTPPGWAARMDRFNDRMLYNLGGGPRPLKFAWVVNAQKGGTLPFLAALMWWYADSSPATTGTAAWVYLALHGGYGLVWLLKDLTFPDPNWQARITLPSTLYAGLGLALYWSFGWLLISGVAQPAYPLPEPAWYMLCIVLCLLGTAIMVAADAQKYYTLRVRRGLITEGMFRYVRHPNYLGEMMIYGSFALLVWHWWPAVVLAWYWLSLFAVNMTMKEVSMSRYPEWGDYKRRSWWLLPGVL